MAKFKVVSSKSKFQTAIKALPADPSLEGESFKALRGKKKGETTDTVGLYIGTAMGTEFNTDKSKIPAAQLFQGIIKRSPKDPKHRLLLVTSNAGKPLNELARECLNQADFKQHKIVSLKPGQAEPDDIPD